MIEAIIPAELADEGAAIRATLAGSLAQARAAAASLATGSSSRVLVIGNGTSYHSALAAATWYRRQATAGDPTVVALTAGEVRHYLPDLGPRDAVIGISASGEFRDVISVMDLLRGRVATVGVGHVAGSSLEQRASRFVLAHGGPSQVPVMTKTFASTLTATLLVLGELLGGPQATGLRTALAGAADDVEAALTTAGPCVDPLAAELRDREHLFVVGSGNAAIAAYEAALKLKEMALVHAEGAESWEMASGAATIVGPGTVVVAIAPTGPGRAATLETAAHAADWGARVVEVGPGSEPSIAGAAHLPLPPTAEEDLAPLTAVAPVALLAYVLGRARGHDADRPDWVGRYHAQGLRHIVGV